MSVSRNICYSFTKLSEHMFGGSIYCNVLRNAWRSRLSKFGGRFVLLGMLFGMCRIIFVEVRFLESVTHEIAFDLRYKMYSTSFSGCQSHFLSIPRTVLLKSNASEIRRISFFVYVRKFE